MRHYKKLNINTILKEISETLKTATTKPKRTTLYTIINISLVLIAIVSLVFNYKIVYPKPKLIIKNASINFDIKAKDDSTFLDSLYVKLNIMNDGNKTTSLNNISLVICDNQYYCDIDSENYNDIDEEKDSDRKDSNDSINIPTVGNKATSNNEMLKDIDNGNKQYIFTAHKFLRSPGIIEPGENSEVILMVEPIICLKIPGTKNIFKIKGIYKVPHKSYKKWQKISKIFDEYFNYVIVTFPIKGRIFLHIEINYGNNKEYEWYRELKYIEPIDLTLPPLSRPRIINYE